METYVPCDKTNFLQTEPNGAACVMIVSFKLLPVSSEFKNQNEVNALPLQLNADEVTHAKRKGEC